MLSRIYSDFVKGFRVFDRLPFFGFGLGVGTNAGCKFITGQSGFLLSEAEWARALLENGPVLGLLFLLWRTALTIRIGWLSLRALGYGETLPIILFSASFVALLNGQFGQPTTLGFACLQRAVSRLDKDRSWNRIVSCAWKNDSASAGADAENSWSLDPCRSSARR